MQTLSESTFTQVGLVVVLLLSALVAYQFTVRLMRGGVRRLAAQTTATWDDRIIERRVLSKLANAVPALILYVGIRRALGLTPTDLLDSENALSVLALLTQRVSLTVIVLSGAISANALLQAINDIYNDAYAEANSRPIKGYLQVVGLALYLTAGVIIVSVLAHRSPVVFLSGLGALTAVLMLIFRDTILSLVASMQILSNDMIRIGDWVEMPQANADGDVIDIALHTVKIQNWDKTISAIPTHKFISDSFKNWRGMSESGGRRIKRSLNLDMSTVRFLTDDEIERLTRYELLHDYMISKRRDLEAYAKAKAAHGDDTIPDVRRLTNVGTFRAYVLNYLKANPKIHEGMTLLVRQLASSPQGVPLEIYCFSNDTAWANYESLQGDIFDHMMSILPEFGLRAFQEPSGSDFARLASQGGLSE